MSKITLMLLASPVAAISGLAAPASAEDVDHPQALVAYDDLDLDSDAGRNRLTQRIRSTINRMCYTNGRVSLREISASRDCDAFAQRSVEPQLAELFKGRGRPQVIVATR